MGRGATLNGRQAVARRAPKGGEDGARGLSLEQIFDELGDFAEAGPDWRTPNAFYVEEAQQFCRSGARGGLELDQAVALRLLKLDYEGDFNAYRRWFEGSRSLVVPPERTCPGMLEAGEALAKVIDRGEKIAVFCDYDVDGTAAGEAFRRGLEPYKAKLYYGYADAESGFGLTEEFVRKAKKAGASTLVTLDCGSGQAEQIALAQSLGMKVIVVDHHHVAENPADFHLNPQLYDPPSSENTGAQLAWKLAAAVQLAREGQTRPEHWEEAMQVAGMGALADMGSVVLPENRAFFWSAHEHPVPGIRALAEALEEDPELPGSMIATQAALNLPKRTTKVSAEEIAAIWSARDAEQAQPVIRKLVRTYEKAKEVRAEMEAKAVKQVGEATWSDSEVSRPDPDKRVASVVFDDYKDYAGYTGVIASKVSRSAAKPAIVFARKGRDEHGQTIYKFSSRNERGVDSKVKLGELIEDPALQQACTIKRTSEDGAVSEGPVLGGHEEVVSGACRAENVEAVVAAYEAWAEGKGVRYWSQPYDGAEAFVSERCVAAERLSEIEAQAQKLGPFSKRQQLVEARRKGREPKLASNRELEISVVGKLSKLRKDPENDNWLAGELELENGELREVRYPADAAKRPSGRYCEWVLRVGRPGPYFLRVFTETKS
jgi:single-stranded DNA-specific DHH superfamily exonuclease